MNWLLNHRFSIYIRYIIAGGIGVAVNLAITYGLDTLTPLHDIVVATIAFTVATVVSFVCQKYVTFGDKTSNSIHIQLTLFVVVCLINIALNALLVALMGYAGLDYLIVRQLLASAIIAVWSFVAYRYIFRPLPTAVPQATEQ